MEEASPEIHPAHDLSVFAGDIPLPRMCTVHSGEAVAIAIGPAADAAPSHASQAATSGTSLTEFNCIG